MNVSPALGAESVTARVIEVSEGNVRPFRLGVDQQGGEAGTIMDFAWRQTAQLEQGRGETEQIDWLRASAGKSASGQTGSAFGNT